MPSMRGNAPSRAADRNHTAAICNRGVPMGMLRIPIVCYFGTNEEGKPVIVDREYADLPAEAVAAALWPAFKQDAQEGKI